MTAVARAAPPALDSILDTVGATPHVFLQRLVPAGSARIFGKLESINPTGSVKDRIGVGMLRAAEADGRLRPGMTIVEPTSGNTGIALAMAAAALGYDLVLTMPAHMSRERVSVMAAYGARIELTPAAADMAGAIARAEARVAGAPERYFMPQQFRNPANPAAHRTGTGVEILAAAGGRIDALVTGVGTGGTITGVGAVLRQALGDSVQIVAVEPACSPVLSGGQAGLHGIQGIGAGFVPQILDRGLVDRVLTVTDEDAFACTRRLARAEGLLVGPSSGANVHAALQVAAEVGAGGTVVTILCDTGFRYFSVEGFIDPAAAAAIT